MGEYYANGLPVIITQGVGDDSDIILNEKLGVIVDEKLQVKLPSLKYILAVNSDRKDNRMVNAAKIHRSISVLENIYRTLITKLDNKEKILF